MRSSGTVLDLYDGAGLQWLDNSIHGNDGTLTANVVREETLNGVEVMDFDSTLSTNVAVPSDISLQCSGCFTWILWAMPTGFNDNKYLISQQVDANNRILLYQEITIGIYRIKINIAGVGYTSANITDTAPTENEWHFLVIKRKTDNKIYTYYNGEYHDVSAAMPGALPISDLNIGCLNAASNFADTKLYRPRVLSYDLPDPQIASLYQGERSLFIP